VCREEGREEEGSESLGGREAAGREQRPPSTSRSSDTSHTHVYHNDLFRCIVECTGMHRTYTIRSEIKRTLNNRTWVQTSGLLLF